MLFRSYPIASRLTLVVLLPLVAVAAWGWLQLRASLPAEGTLTIPKGVSASTVITRDSAGVPHIRAANEYDAFFAVGYVHAQDRLWQLELQRRMARGRLSEVFGKKSIDADAWFRTLGLYASTKSAWHGLSPSARESLTAYTAGINAWLSERHPLPIEFRTLGVAPEPWTELDSLAWVKMFALDLGGNFDQEMRHFVARQSMTEAQIATFFPTYPEDAPTTIRTGAPQVTSTLNAMLDAQRTRQQDFGLSVPGTGSNAWVVAGTHTADGAALLANDPHLGLRIPSSWYAISIDTPKLKASGMGLVGLPLVVFGRNDRIAWGGTNMMADAQDLFFERTNPEGTRYEAEGRWIRFDHRVELIEVRQEFPQALRKRYVPVRITVRTTRHGPVISDRYGVFDSPVSLRWTALDDDDTSYEAFYRLNHARDWHEFCAALRLHVAPAMNMVYADREGAIGYLAAGRIPIRKRGEGVLPSPGWSDEWGWRDYVPPTAWPSVFNPPSGYIVTANNKVVDSGYPYFISNDWAPPARAERIEQLLRGAIATGHPLSIESMRSIQSDTLDLSAAQLMDYLRGRLPKGGRRDAAARLLRDWRGDMGGESAAATIFTEWMRQLRLQLFAPRMRADWGRNVASDLLSKMGESVEYGDLLAVLREDRGGWCMQDCDAALGRALDAALWELHKRNGTWDMDDWHWSENQSTKYAHMPFSQSKALARIFERRISNGGSANTIDAAASKYQGSEGYVQTLGPGFRQVISLDPAGIRHFYMNSTGQSGNVFSPHYDDMIEMFRDARLQPLVATYDRAHARRLITPNHFIPAKADGKTQ
ncbi:penicillin acylase family protein [Xanthomonas sp. GW]|uniref:penicillin acylase family protein n=1 Tax=Xanthomonas sp. GW TaxID=2724121 RepID=UPI00163AC912|nr:penicillin acylase family protein [Xanthomonas sp. GW]QNH20770.1 penicillin acylase family protein [Xanthomonas sp. GW]